MRVIGSGTISNVYAPERWVDDALFRPEVREAYRRLVEQGVDRRAAGAAPGRANLHVLEIFPERVRPGRRAAHRSPAVRRDRRAKERCLSAYVLPRRGKRWILPGLAIP